MDEELIEIVDPEGKVLGVAPRSEVHGNPALMHRVVHVLVFNARGELLLQKRSMADTSVGGHVDPGETLEDAAKRELSEELGVETEPRFLYSYVHSNDYETELVHTYYCVHEGPFEFNREEIDHVRFWPLAEIRTSMEGAVLSDNFKHEITTYLGTL
jgi:isopentenyldiphosphate isomerase